MKTRSATASQSLIQIPTLTTGYIPEPLLEFSDQRRHVDPKTGIIRFGPKSLRPGNRHPQRIRTGFIGTPETIAKAGAWIESTSHGVKGAPERLEFRGFRQDRGFYSEVELSSDWNAPIFNSDVSDIRLHRKGIDRFESALQLVDNKLSILYRKDRKPEYVILALPDSLLADCRDVEYTSVDFGYVHRNFRRAIKAVAMKYGFPTQIMLERTADGKSKDYPSDIAWDFFTAMYFKAGGFPWGPVGLTPGSCYVGIGFYHPLGAADSRVQSSMVQAFDEHGDGLVLRGQDFAWDAKQEGTRAPHLTEDQAIWTIERTLQRYHDEMHQKPTRLVIHKTSRFWPAESKGFRAALEQRDLQYDLVALRPDDSARLFPVNQYPPLRGTRYTVSETDFIYTTGFQADLQQFHANHVPCPLQLSDHIGGDTSRHRLLEEVLILSKMNFNCALMGGLFPITLNFARRVGDILKEVRAEDPDPLANFKFYI
jgi:hypothetical protein